MNQYITLLMGSEQVQSAGNQIASAAHDMKQAASNTEQTFLQFRDFMNDWLARFEQVLAYHRDHEQH